MLIVLLGPPAAGKGTQAKKICEYLDIPHISTGDILRQNIKKKTELGLLADALISKGNFVSDSVIVPLVRQRIEMPDCLGGCLLDGFPRTVSQAEVLDSFARPDMVFNIDIPAAALISRVTGRRVCEACGKSFHVSTHGSENCHCGETLSIRDDDREDVFVTRLLNYEQLTLPVTKFYEEQGRLENIFGDVSPDEVFDRIKTVLQKRLLTEQVLD